MKNSSLYQLLLLDIGYEVLGNPKPQTQVRCPALMARYPVPTNKAQSVESIAESVSEQVREGRGH